MQGFFTPPVKISKGSHLWCIDGACVILQLIFGGVRGRRLVTWLRLYICVHIEYQFKEKMIELDKVMNQAAKTWL
jgi:hypothetical protein